MPLNETAYQLKLPRTWLTHNAFHLSLLKPYKGDPPTKPIVEESLAFETRKKSYNRKVSYDMKIKSYKVVR